MFQSCHKLDTMGVSSRTGVISVIYKKCDKKDTANYRSISVLNLECKVLIIIGERKRTLWPLFMDWV